MRLLLVLALLSVPAFAADRSFARLIPVSSESQITVSTTSGSIHLHPGSEIQMLVKAELRAMPGASSDVDSRISRIIANPIQYVPKGTLLKRRETPITAGQKIFDPGVFGDDVVVDTRVLKGDYDLYKDIIIDLDITVPHATRIFANSDSGDIRVEDPGTLLFVTALSGSINVTGKPGRAWSISSGSGNINVTIDPAAAIALLTRTLSGRLRVDFPLTPPPGGDGVSMIVGANHPELPGAAHLVVSVNSKSGNIAIR